MTLTEYIVNDLRRRIQSGEDVSPRLSLADLAKDYDVSVTPLRSALSTLVAEGHVEKLPNGRLRIPKRKARAAASAVLVPVPPTPRDWEAPLLREVMLWSLRRHAAYMREESLGEKLGAGRSIIRQTFSRFAAVGLIEHVPRRGWLVRPLSEKDMNAYLIVREILELKALGLAKHRLVTADLRELIAGTMGTGPRTASQLDNRLHEYVIQRSGNRYIRNFFRQYNARYYTELFYHAAPETSVVSTMALQHRRILQAFVSGAWTLARRLLSEHIRAQGPILTKLLSRGDDEDERRGA